MLYTETMVKFGFQNLLVWEKAIKMAVITAQIANDFAPRYQSSFGDQLRRAGLSIPNNIAEGNGRKTRKESSNFYNISKGSVYECLSILEVGTRLGLIDWSKHDRNELESLAEEICKMLHGLMNRP
jgi:four helix bundle protein